MSNKLALKEKYNQFGALLEQQRPNIQAVLPPGWDAERMIASIRLAAIREPKLLDCTKASLVRAAIESARLGLDCSGVGGYAYLVPFKNKNQGTLEATLIPGYRGLIRAAYRAGVARNIRAEVVYEGDEFQEVLGSAPALKHIPNRWGDRGKPIAVYAIAFAGDPDDVPPLWVTMSIDEVKSIEDRSKARSFSPWKTAWTEMAKKTAIRRLCKLLPGGDELDQVLALEDRAWDGLPTRGEALSAGAEAVTLAVEEETKAKRLAKKIKASEEKEDGPEPEIIEPEDSEEAAPETAEGEADAALFGNDS